MKSLYFYSFFACLWVGQVFFSWTRGHFSNTKELLLTLHDRGDLFFLPYATLLTVCVGLGMDLYSTRHAKGKETIIAVSPVIAIITLLGYILLIYGVSVFTRTAPGTGVPLVENISVGVFSVIILTKMLFTLTWMVVTGLAGYLLGHRICTYLSTSLQDITGIMYHMLFFALGGVGWVVIGFSLGLLGMLRKEALLVITALIFVMEYKTLWLIIKYFFSSHNIRLYITPLRLWIALGMLLLFALNILSTLRLVPTGFDDVTTYLNRAHLMSAYGTLVPGGNPFSFEILAAIGYALSDNFSLIVGFNIVFALLSAIVIYGFSQHFFPKKSAALLAAFVWLSLPMTNYMIFRDVKADLFLFFITTLAFWLFFVWFRNKDKTHVLYLCAFLVGFAWTIKITTVFTIIALGLAYMIIVYRWTSPLRLKVKTSIFALVIFLLPIVPWLVYGAVTQLQGNNFSLATLNTSYSQSVWHVGERRLSVLGIDQETCPVMQGASSEVGRYSGNHTSRWGAMITAPWELTMNTRLRVYFLEIGYLFLAFVPLFYVLLIKNYFYKRSVSRDVWLLAGVSLVYWCVWLVFGRNIIWYGFPGFLFLVFMVVYVAYQYTQNVYIKKIFIASIVFGAGMLVLYRTGSFPEYATLQDVSAQKTITQKTDAIYQSAYVRYVDAMHHNEGVAISDPRHAIFVSYINTHDDGKVLLTATRAIYYIDHNDTRVIQDRYLDLFTCLHSDGRADMTKERLRAMGVKYIFFNKSIGKNVEYNVDIVEPIRSNRDHFMTFAKKNLNVEIETNEYSLYSLPGERK